MEVGREIARQGAVLVTGATTGIPFWAAKGAKEAGGMSIGISPAISEFAHVKTYRLPTDYFDLIIYTGFDYTGRDLLLIRSSDAIITICGRMGSLHEFTVAFEDRKTQGVLTGSGGAADFIPEIVEKMHRGPGKIVYESDPKQLVHKVIQSVEKDRSMKTRKYGGLSLRV